MDKISVLTGLLFSRKRKINVRLFLIVTRSMKKIVIKIE